MKNLTSSIYTFEDLILGDYVYVDKTEYLWNLVRQRKGIYFLSRPRRFGKSLTISTLEAIFKGRRELFKGLAIDGKPYDWKTHPVIHLNFADCMAAGAGELRKYLSTQIRHAAEDAGSAVETDNDNPGGMFEELVRTLSAKGDVVILVDEYDKPLLNHLSDAAATRELMPVIKGFYSVIKKCEEHERFVLVTGVTKFCHVSLFSDLNNLQDISMSSDYATMLGYTQAEFEENFSEWLSETAARQELPREQYLARIKSWYDGYRFEETAECVYNPVSLVMFFLNHGNFSNYWFATGTPSFLMELIRQRQMRLEQAVTDLVSPFAFGSFEIDNIPPLTLLLQTGYLTIKSSEKLYGQMLYRLDFPNREVSESFNVYLLNAYSRTSQNEAANFCTHLAIAIADGDLPKFQKALEAFFAGIPYDVHRKSEANFQNIFFAIFKLLGYTIHAESRTCDGRIDAVLETEGHIYLFEFKLDKDDSALAQIKAKEYFKPYLLSNKKITLVGANFDTAAGRLSDWKNEDILA